MTSAITAAAASYVINCGLGTAVALRWVDTRRYRWVHHALFISTAVLTSAAIASRERGSVVLAPALIPLGILPFARRGRHAPVALAAAPFYLAALITARR